ncbi:MAG TPA: class I SAM-dependent methyltransferase [Thermoanaerobaculia bacterium]
MELQQIAPGLARDAAGYWVAPNDAAASYPADAHDYCLSFEEESFWFAHRSAAIAAAVRRWPPAAGPIFDVGAGNGYVTASLQRAGIRTIAIEPGRTGAANAVSRGVSEVVCGALPSAAFREATAGGIGLFDVVEHIEDDRGYLRDLARYLQPGGRLYLTVPAYPWLWSRNDITSGHKRRYTSRTLRDAVTAAGYRVDYATYFFSLLPPAIFLGRTLRSRLSPREVARASSRAQHRAGGGAMRGLAQTSLAFEIRRIERGATIPFGASLLLTASVARA